MTSRRAPLGPRNGDYPPLKSQKKPKSSVPPMDRGDLVAVLRKISDIHCSPEVQVNVQESDLTNPTPDRVEQIFHMLLYVLYEITPTMMTQGPLSTTVQYPELYDDACHYTLNFLRILHRVMDACVVPEHDFRPHDLTDPQPKRIHHFFAAIVNYIKFTQLINKECHVCEYNEKMTISNDSLQEVRKNNNEMKQKIKQLRQQKIEEKEQETNLQNDIVVAERELTELQSVQIDFEEKLENCQTELAQAQKKQDIIKDEYTCLYSRLEELKLQIVSSPEELNEKLVSIETELNEMGSIHEECLSNHNMWEMLSTKASNVLPGITSIKDDVTSLVEKANVITDKMIIYEKTEDNIKKCKQTRKEYLAKTQNVIRHLKLIQEEMRVITEIKTKPNEITKTNELEMELVYVKSLLKEKVTKDSEMEKQIEEKKMLLDKLYKDHAKFLTQYETAVIHLKQSYESHAQILNEIELLV